MEKNNSCNNESKSNCFLAIAAVIIGMVFVSMGLWGGFNLGLTITNLLLLTTGTIYLKRKNIKIGFNGILLLIVCSLGSLVFSLTANLLVNIALFSLLFLSISAYFYYLNRGSKALGDLRIVPIVFASTFATTLENLSKSTKAIIPSRVKNGASYKKLLIGFLCAVPVLTVVLPLLVSSDAAFENLFKSISEDILLWFLKFTLGILISPIIFSYFFSNRNYKDNFNFKNGLKGNKIDGLYAISFLAAISVCYLVYLFSQLAYIFSGLHGILPEAFTVAEYARRGFFEISAIAVINFLIMGSSLLFIKQTGTKKDKIIRFFLWFVGVFTMLLIITAIAKMVLYIGSFGMTELRILTSMFLVFLFVICIVFLLRTLTPKIAIFRPAIMVALVLLTTLGFVGTNRLVSAYNTEAYISGKLETVDLSAMSENGYVSAKYLIKLERHLAESEKEIGAINEQYSETMHYLIEIFDDMYNIDKKGKYRRADKFNIESFNLEKELAYSYFENYINENSAFLDKVQWQKNGSNAGVIYNEEEYRWQKEYGELWYN